MKRNDPRCGRSVKRRGEKGDVIDFFFLSPFLWVAADFAQFKIVRCPSLPSSAGKSAAGALFPGVFHQKQCSPWFWIEKSSSSSSKRRKRDRNGGFALSTRYQEADDNVMLPLLCFCFLIPLARKRPAHLCASLHTQTKGQRLSCKWLSARVSALLREKRTKQGDSHNLNCVRSFLFQ